MTRGMLGILGLLMACVGTSLLLPLGVSLWYADGAAPDIALSLAIMVGGGLVIAWLGRSSGPQNLTHRQGLAAVGLCWIVAGLAGGLPYALSGQLGWTDAVFEAVSGFTTTGATVFRDLEIVPRGLLMWRSLTHWLGGLGIMVLSLAVLPLLDVGGMQLYKAEVPGPSPDKLTPRVRDTAKLLWGVYVLLTVAEIILLLCGGMDLFDAVNHSFSTVATGGFSTRNASIAAFPGPFIQWVIIFFMFAAGVNFALHLRFLRGDVSCYVRNSEFRAYALVLGAGIVLTVAALAGYRVFAVSTFAEAETAVRAAAFQVVSICTTTGFVTENYALWPPLTLAVLLLLTFIGGCAGSTGGGFKVMRLDIVSRLAWLDFFQFLHPRSVRHLKLDGKPVPSGVSSGVAGFLLLYLALLLIATLALTAFDLDLITAFSSVLTCLGNVGPGLGSVGPVDNFGHLPSLVKWILSLCMLLGRLEIYAILALFMPEFWRQ